MRKTSRSHDVQAWLARPIIPVLWKAESDVETLADASLIFVQGCELVDLNGILTWLKSGPLAKIPVAVHVDLLGGLSSDEAGLRYLATLGRIEGVITVRSHVASAARKLGFASILLLFLQDGRSVERGLHIVEQSRPDIIELVPGVAALETARQFEGLSIPRIAGGLVRTPWLVNQILGAGFNAVSSSQADLWPLNRTALRRAGGTK